MPSASSSTTWKPRSAGPAQTASCAAGRRVQSAPACLHSTRVARCVTTLLTGPAIDGGRDRPGRSRGGGRARRHPAHGRGDGGVRAPHPRGRPLRRARPGLASRRRRRRGRDRRVPGDRLRPVSERDPECAVAPAHGCERRRRRRPGRAASGRLATSGRQAALLDQCEQPEPQPPPCASGAASEPSSTVNEWPQPQEAWAFGLSILNPDSSSPERKSIVAPLRYGTL